MTTIPHAACTVALALLTAVAASAQDGVRRQPVHFAPGKSSASITGTITGDQIVDYVLAASAGQQMQVTLKTSNPGSYFNVLPPGSEEAVFNGSVSGNTWRGPLATGGDYRVRVYLMRSAARRNETARYTLTLRITGSKVEK